MINNIMLVSDVQQTDCVYIHIYTHTHTHIYVYLKVISPFRLLHN